MSPLTHSSIHGDSVVGGFYHRLQAAQRPTRAQLVARAQHFFQDQDFRFGPAHPQAWEYLVYHNLYSHPYEKYVWECAYQEARLERAQLEGLAVTGPCGIDYTG